MFLSPIQQKILEDLTQTSLSSPILEDLSLTPEIIADFWQIQQLLQKGYPLDYLLSHSHIAGLKLKLTPDVLIPRPETEEWVTKIIHECTIPSNHPILDLGSGSGFISILLSKHLPNQILASDVSLSALALAQYNAQINQTSDISFFHSNLLNDSTLRQTLKQSKSWILVSNPPYVPTHEKPQAKQNRIQYEPTLAIYSGSNGLSLFQRLVWQIQFYQPLPTQCYFELHPDNIHVASKMMQNIGYSTQIWPDFNQLPRVLICQLDKIYQSSYNS